MRKNIYILIFLVILPLFFLSIYDKRFYLSGNWTEDYAGNFKLGFLAVSILGNIWIFFRSRKIENIKAKYFWEILSLILIVLLVYFFYFLYSWLHVELIL